MPASIKAGSATVLCLLVFGCGGSDNGIPIVDSDPETKGVFDGYSGNLSYEGQGGDVEGVGVGGDGGIGAGGSLGQFRGVEAVVFLENASELGRTIISSQSGLFTIKPGRTYTGPLLLELREQTGAQYYGEAKKYTSISVRVSS